VYLKLVMQKKYAIEDAAQEFLRAMAGFINHTGWYVYKKKKDMIDWIFIFSILGIIFTFIVRSRG